MQSNPYNRYSRGAHHNSAFASNNQQGFNQQPVQSFNQQPVQPFVQPFNQSFNQPFNQPFNQTFNQPFNQSYNAPFDRSFKEHVSPFSQPSNAPNQHISPFAQKPKPMSGAKVNLLDEAIGASLRSNPYKPTKYEPYSHAYGNENPFGPTTSSKAKYKKSISPYQRPNRSLVNNRNFGEQSNRSSINQHLGEQSNSSLVNQNFGEQPFGNQHYGGQPNAPVFNNHQQPNTPVFNNHQQSNTLVFNNHQQPNTSVFNNHQQPNTPVFNNYQQPNTLVFNNHQQPNTSVFNNHQQPNTPVFNNHLVEQPNTSVFNKNLGGQLNTPVFNTHLGEQQDKSLFSLANKRSGEQSNTPVFNTRLGEQQNKPLFSLANKPAGEQFTPSVINKRLGKQPAEKINAAAPVYTPITRGAIQSSKPTFNNRLGKGPNENVNTPSSLQSFNVKNTPKIAPNQTPKSSLFLANDPGKSTPEKRAQRFGAYQVLYQEFKERRIIERKQAIRDGLIPNPDQQTNLEDAIDFRGTCTVKCPEFEMLERDMQNDLDDLEKDAEGNIDPEKAVKKYRRSAAGGEQPLPSDVRTPEALNDTLDYLVDEILANYPIEKCHKFVRDRTRSIRQDFTLQNIRDLNAVDTHERIARFHILSLHEMCEYDESVFSLPQEMEQLNKTLISLMEFYDDLRDEGIETENEAEFRAYYIISQIKDEDIAQRTMRLPIYVFKNPYIIRALQFRALSQRNNEILETSSRRNKPLNIEACQNFYSRFFQLIADPGTPFLMACLLETHFSEVRKGALKAMNASYMMKAGGVQAEYVRQVLAYDTTKQLFKEAMLYGIVIDNSLGEPTLSFGQKHYSEKFFLFKEPLSNPSQRKSLLLVEPKKAGRTFRDIVNGINSHITPLANQNVFAAQSNQVNPEATTEVEKRLFVTQPKVTEIKSNKGKAREIEQVREAEKERVRHYVDIKNQAALAKEFAEKERKKLEELIEKRRQEENLRLEALRLKEALRVRAILHEEQKLREENMMKQRQELEKERKKQAKLLELARKKELEQKIIALRFEVIRSRACTKLLAEIVNDCIEKEIKSNTIRTAHRKQLCQKYGFPWLGRAKARISKRAVKAMHHKRDWHFNMYMVTHNPYIPSDDTIYKAIPSHAKPEEIAKRAKQSIEAEKIALETTDCAMNEKTIWDPVDFSLQIYPRIRDLMLNSKRPEITERETKTWQLLIDVKDPNSDSSRWFRQKFDLDDTFLRKDSHYVAYNIETHMITSNSEISCDRAYETGAVIFSIPAGKLSKTPAETASHWEECRQRLEKLTKQLHAYNPALKVPMVFTYFPDSSSTESTVEKIPTLLGLDKNYLVSDYHILIMTPSTISERLPVEVNWLARNSVEYWLN